MNLNDSILQELCRIARLAGEAILSVYHESDSRINHWKKEDCSPLTEADLQSDAIIRQGLETAYPGYFILSEESTSQVTTQSPDTFFLVDPLDGTKEFIKRNGEFTVNIALIQQGYPVAGVVYAPALQSLYFAQQGHGAWKQLSDDAPPVKLAVHPPQDGAPIRVIGSRSHSSEALVEWLSHLPRHSFVPAGSSLKFCRVAEGLADIYPRLAPTMQWDTAAGQCVLEQAGGQVVDMSGQRLAYGLNRPYKNPYFFAVGDSELMSLVKPVQLSCCKLRLILNQ
jgi:3'(2'), 5'-bisphosphate nucleotidase